MKYNIAKSYLKRTFRQQDGDILVSVNLMHLLSSYSIIRNVQINIKRIYLYYKADIHESFYGIKGQINKIPISTEAYSLLRHKKGMIKSFYLYV